VAEHTDRRITGTVDRGQRVTILVDGEPVVAYEGENVAAALLAGGRRTLRTTPRQAEPRGMYCGIGLCFDCLVPVDGSGVVRACQTPVRAGMRIGGAW
jgi:predicted molibdopterin-dependent oxidoreductase YjgC